MLNLNERYVIGKGKVSIIEATRETLTKYRVLCHVKFSDSFVRHQIFFLLFICFSRHLHLPVTYVLWISNHLYTHTHRHTHIYIYVYIRACNK